MPYKEPRPQLNLKVTNEEYSVLEFEAFRAGTSVHTYVRHLVLSRQKQPLGIEAALVRVYYKAREEKIIEQMEEYREAAFSVNAMKQRIRELEQTVRELAEAKLFPEMVDEALSRHVASLQQPKAKPFPVDRYEDTPEIEG